MKNIEMQTAYIVNDHEDNKTYFFESEKSALNWKKELVEEFGVDEGNISVIERTYDKYGNWVSQKYIKLA